VKNTSFLLDEVKTDTVDLISSIDSIITEKIISMAMNWL